MTKSGSQNPKKGIAKPNPMPQIDGMKSTHIGTCQLCNAVQKLPGGRLASHGYTIRWGFFAGVCSGSHQLPLEESCDYLRHVRDVVQASIDECKPEERAARKQFLAAASRILADWKPGQLAVVSELEQAESVKKAAAAGIRVASANLKSAKYHLSNVVEKFNGFASSRCYAELATLDRPTSTEAYYLLPDAARAALNKAVNKIHSKWAKLESHNINRARAAAEAVKASQTDAAWLAAADAVLAAVAVYAVALEAYNALKAA